MATLRWGDRKKVNQVFGALLALYWLPSIDTLGKLLINVSNPTPQGCIKNELFINWEIFPFWNEDSSGGSDFP